MIFLHRDDVTLRAHREAVGVGLTRRNTDNLILHLDRDEALALIAEISIAFAVEERVILIVEDAQNATLIGDMKDG